MFNEEVRIFIDISGHNYSIDYPRYILTKLSEILSIKLPSHMLKHTFASQVTANRMSSVEVARWLGHTKIDMTLNTYSHSPIKGKKSLLTLRILIKKIPKIPRKK